MRCQNRLLHQILISQVEYFCCTFNYCVPELVTYLHYFTIELNYCLGRLMFILFACAYCLDRLLFFPCRETLQCFTTFQSASLVKDFTEIKVVAKQKKSKQ